MIVENIEAQNDQLWVREMWRWLKPKADGPDSPDDTDPPRPPHAAAAVAPSDPPPWPRVFPGL